MRKADKYSVLMWLSIALAAICFIGAAYIIIDFFLKTKDIDFTWTTNILVGAAGALLIVSSWFKKTAKENSGLFDA